MYKKKNFSKQKISQAQRDWLIMEMQIMKELNNDSKNNKRD